MTSDLPDRSDRYHIAWNIWVSYFEGHMFVTAGVGPPGEPPRYWWGLGMGFS